MGGKRKPRNQKEREKHLGCFRILKPDRVRTFRAHRGGRRWRTSMIRAQRS